MVRTMFGAPDVPLELPNSALPDTHVFVETGPDHDGCDRGPQIPEGRHWGASVYGDLQPNDLPSTVSVCCCPAAVALMLIVMLLLVPPIAGTVTVPRPRLPNTTTTETRPLAQMNAATLPVAVGVNRMPGRSWNLAALAGFR